jgi:pyrroline-5-carboxylate reductase
MLDAAFIGLGSMGNMLVGGFIESGGLTPSDIIVANRTKKKLDDASMRWPGIHIAASNAEAASAARHVFICVRPLDVKAVLEEIRPSLSTDAHIVSIAGTVPVEGIESLTGCAATKVGPAVTSEVRAGVSLVCHGGKVRPDDAAFTEGLLRRIGVVKVLPERDYELAIELTSCMPGFIASIFQEVTESAMRHTQTLSRADAEEMVLKTLLGTARLLTERNMSFDEAITRVATPGGITEEGVRVLRSKLPQALDEMFDRTLEKRRIAKKKAESQYL